MIWDRISGRQPGEGPVEEWGGISYALAAFDAALLRDWQVVPLIKVGRDLAGRANQFLASLSCVAGGARFVEVPAVNPRVHLVYRDDQRRCEGLTGGVPPWTWQELGPMLLGLDALYVNFITGFETDLAVLQAVRRAFAGPLYGDLHSLTLGIQADGTRYPRRLEAPLDWLACCDVAQLNEDEMGLLGPDPMRIAAGALERGTGAVCVTMGPRGAAFVAAGDFGSFGWAGRGEGRPQRKMGASVVATALVETEGGRAGGDPTGCGDVFGATMTSRLLAGESLEPAIRAANRMAKRNVTYRGASGLQHHLRGGLTAAAAF
jgi:sugar/nucleoside kinase (ribokinase family)